MTWRYVEASAVGSAHRIDDAPCQDRCACAVITSRNGGDILVTVVSDGAGSAAYGERGAQTVCDILLMRAVEAARSSDDLDAVGDGEVRTWFRAVRDELEAQALAAEVELREFAATALLTLAGDRRTLCARIGDGGIVVRRAPHAAFEVALWPDGGEYANQTYFITDEAAGERIAIARFDAVSDVISFSDGLQNLALELATRSAFSPFFTPLVAAVREAPAGNGRLRADLLAFLSSASLDERTTDDKSLVVGCRIVAA